MPNEEILLRANTHRQLLNVLKQQKTSYLGHILRGPDTSLDTSFYSHRKNQGEKRTRI